MHGAMKVKVALLLHFPQVPASNISLKIDNLENFSS
jgi:hypothetical protein